MRRAVAREERRQNVQARRRGRAEPDSADGAARDLLHPLTRAIDGGKDPARFLEHHLARNRQRHAPRGAIQEPRADFAFELRDLVRDCRLRQVAGDGGPREMPVLGDGDERPERSEVHALIEDVYRRNSIISLDESVCGALSWAATRRCSMSLRVGDVAPDLEADTRRTA